MRREGRNGGDPREWMRRARSNLARARAGRVAPEVLLEDLCFDAQQAAEKAIKAVLVDRGIPFPKTHDLIALLTLLANSGMPIPEDIKEADDLTGYAVEARYPCSGEEVTEEEDRRASELTGRVYRWAEASLGEGSGETGPSAL